MLRNPSTNNPGWKKDILERIALEWHSANIPYAVAHGLEHYPKSLGRDVDVMIDRANSIGATMIVARALQEMGWATVVHKKPWAWWIIGTGIVDGTIRSIEIDLVFYLHYGPATLVEGAQPIYKVGPFYVDPWAGFVKRIFIQLLSGNFHRFQNRPDELVLKKEEISEVEPRLSALLGKEVSFKLLHTIQESDLSTLQRLMPAVRKKLLIRALWIHPGKFFITVGRWVCNELRLSLFASPCAPWIAFVGPDGVGKSTVIEKVREQIGAELPFTRVLVKHWRPGLFPRLSRLKGGKSTESPSGPPRRQPGRWKYIRLLYYFLDAFLGWHLLDKPALSTLQLILYDRCMLDMAVDSLRYGLPSGKEVLWLWRFLPKPDLVILLHVDPEVVYQRKQELSQAELEQQLQQWLHFLEIGLIDMVVPNEASPEEIASRITHSIQHVLLSKNFVLMGSHSGVKEENSLDAKLLNHS